LYSTQILIRLLIFDNLEYQFYSTPLDHHLEEISVALSTPLDRHLEEISVALSIYDWIESPGFMCRSLLALNRPNTKACVWGQNLLYMARCTLRGLVSQPMVLRRGLLRERRRIPRALHSYSAFEFSSCSVPSPPCVWLHSPHINHGGVQNGLTKGNEFFLRYRIVI